MDIVSTKNNKIKIAIILAILLTIFVGFFVFLSKNEKFEQILNNFSITPKPETFTELYFNNHLELPKKSIAGGLISFSFVVHNVEGVKKVYPYSVYFEYLDGYRVVFKKGIITLNNDESKNTTVNYVFKNSDLEGKVVVELIDLKQEIHFFVSKNN